MNSGKNDCNSKIQTLFEIFCKYKGGQQGKIIIVTDKYSRPIFFYPKTIKKLSDINLGRADILQITVNSSLD